MYFSIASYRKVGTDAIIEHMESPLNTKDMIEGRRDLFEDGRDEDQEKLETAEYDQQQLLDGMVLL